MKKIIKMKVGREKKKKTLSEFAFKTIVMGTRHKHSSTT